ncbi:ABC transporter permease [Paenibacillus frigoriresistens]|nr:ABC transporter permease [Paenibacillus frigoriresistens]
MFKFSQVKKMYKFSAFGIVMILLSMCAILATVSDKFLTFDNLFSVFRSFSFIGMMAIGECLVIVAGGIDLSVGSVFAFSGVVSALGMTQWGLPIPVSLSLGLLSGVAFGWMNGLIITKVKLPPFIATLGTMSIARGLSYVITGGYPIPNMPESFKFIGSGHIGPIPFPVLLLIILGIIFSVFLRKTIIGRRIYAIGGNEEAARVSGIHINRVKIYVYTLSGFLAAVAGIATVARLGVGQSTAGIGYELDTIAAVIIGGASVNGGVGTVFGAIIGAAIMGVLKNGLILLNVSAYWQQTVIGCVVLLAVTLDLLRNRKSARRP